jgi:hypothetical protein
VTGFGLAGGAELVRALVVVGVRCRGADRGLGSAWVAGVVGAAGVGAGLVDDVDGSDRVDGAVSSGSAA